MLEVLSHHRTSFSPMQHSNEEQDGRKLPPIATQLPDLFKKESRLTFPVTPDSANEVKKNSPVKRKREESGSGDERPTQKRQLTAQSPVESRRSLSGSFQPQTYHPRHSAVTSPAQSQRVISPSTRSEPSVSAGTGHVRLPSINAPPPPSVDSSHTSPLVSPLTRQGPTSIPTSPPVREPLSSFKDPSRGPNTISLPPLRDLAREPPSYRPSEASLPPTTSSGESKLQSAYDPRPYRAPAEHPPAPPPPPAPATTTSPRVWHGSRPSNPGRSPITDRFYPSERPPTYSSSTPRSHHQYDTRPTSSSRPYESYSGGHGARPPDSYTAGSASRSRGYDSYHSGPPPADRPDYSRQPPPPPPPHHHHPPPPPPPPHHTRSHSHPQGPPPPLPPQQPPHVSYNSSYPPPPVNVHGSSMGRPGDPAPLRSPLYPSSAAGSGQFNWDVGGASDPYNRKRRGNLPKESTAILNAWFLQHIDHPYPKEEEKQNLQTQTGLTMSQISNWFINARRRRRPTALHRNPTGPGLDWER